MNEIKQDVPVKEIEKKPEPVKQEEKKKTIPDFPDRIYAAAKRFDDKEKEIGQNFQNDIIKFKSHQQGYSDLTENLDKVKKTLDQVTHLLNEKVKAEVLIREKKCDDNKRIVLAAETEIIEILKGAT